MFHEVAPARRGGRALAPSPGPASRPGSLWYSGIVPTGLLGIFLFLTGGIWDVSWHIDIGRDTFFSPPHLLLYAGLLTMALTPLWALVRARALAGVPPAALAGPTIRLRRVPISPAIVIGGLGALLAFASGPVDEFWHRLFGLDVTIWSPPHMQLLFGAVLAALGLVAALAGELNRAYPQRLRPDPPAPRVEARWLALVLAFAMLLMLLGGTLGEYSFGIPQHALYWHPLLLPAIGLGVLFAAGRTLGSAWGATAVAVCYLVVDLALYALLALMGRTLPVSAVIVPAAIVVDVLWTQRGRSAAPRRAALPALAATLVLLASQLEFLRVESAVPWPLEAWPRLLPAALLSGAAGALLGARIGAALRPVAARATPPPDGSRAASRDARKRARPNGRVKVPVGLAMLALGLVLLPGSAAAQSRSQPAPLRVEFRLTSVPPAAGEPASFEVRFAPPGAVDLETARMSLRQGDVTQPVRLEPTGDPNTLRATVVPPSRGGWSLPLRFADRDGQRWLGWASIRAAAPGQTWRPAIPIIEVKLQPDRTRELTAQDAFGLTAGKVFVWLTIGIAFAGGLYALRAVERDGRRLAAQAE